MIKFKYVCQNNYCNSISIFDKPLLEKQCPYCGCKIIKELTIKLYVNEPIETKKKRKQKNTR